MTIYSIYHDVLVNSDSKTLFDAITLPEHLNNWWPLKSSGKPELHNEYNFYFSPEYDWYGKVIHYELNASFHIKMTQSDSDWDPTTFGFNLEEINNDIQLHFFHINWSKRNHHFKCSSFCWAMLLNGLKNYVEKGIVVTFKERA